MGWRYQPVIEKESNNEEVVYLIEVYFDDDGKLKYWSWGKQWACGESISELQVDLTMMLMDSYKWKPVRYDEIKVGMVFERQIDQEQCEGIARMVESVSFAARPRIQ